MVIAYHAVDYGWKGIIAIDTAAVISIPVFNGEAIDYAAGVFIVVETKASALTLAVDNAVCRAVGALRLWPCP